MARLYFYYSAMNAGKTTLLLQSSYNYKERGLRTMLYTAKIDNRTEVGIISSRIGLSKEANLYSLDTNLYDEIDIENNKKKLDCILIDECQFLSKVQVKQLCNVVDKLKIPVLCYGLRTDFRGELFEGSQYLLAWCDKLIEVKTICHCGRKATMTMRIDQCGDVVLDGEQIKIGGNESYVSVCREHYMLKVSKQ
ncbi:thymidine kinase family protein [Cryptosporidium muris RN66]|uniref:Thymidine kinase n=1 Tax=Cryptosporidium muris (strain RN66) TaxID=441375 RepID=B6A9B2_CRYMR|nr:thymidine kinase family protein [Cryptosporidium muris RN66]EEA04803.1 thymidine kinase family protein [Cryptosporidium muris RN66]|eukprot:XP_002139152.1 thymidine kinase family protein [Cryptosporidium muris RN66]